MLKSTLTKNSGLAIAVALAPLLIFSFHHHRAFGQSASAATIPAGIAAAPSQPSPDLEGSGEQLRVIAAIYAVWSQDRRPKGGNDSPDIADYRFRIAESGANDTVTLWPKKPVIKRIPTPQGVRMESESSTFYFTVRRSDFKVVGRSAIM